MAPGSTLARSPQVAYSEQLALGWPDCAGAFRPLTGPRRGPYHVKPVCRRQIAQPRGSPRKSAGKPRYMPPSVIDVRAADDSRDVVHRAVQALAEGRIVAVPTETVYTLAVSARIPAALERLAAIKQRPAGEGFSLAIKSADDALDYAPDLCPLGARLARRCWPGPVTLIVDDSHPESVVRQLPDAVRRRISPQGALGLRVPAHATVLDVLRLLVGPVVLTSAHRPSQAESLTAQDVLQSLGDDVDLVLDDGRSRFGQPSSIVRVRPGGYDVLRVGVVSTATLKRLSSLMIVFVCTGNTCRSPMAEVMFRRLLADRLRVDAARLEDRGVLVMSAGIAAMMGGRPTEEAVSVMREAGLDLARHESQPLTPQLVRHADLLIAMTRSHRQAILAEWPEAAERIHLLSAGGGDVADPIGGPLEQYARCASQIREELESWVRKIEL
jgi:tRNA threonylcarbamoyl adenosine modification protein (Sua5/YciO/YrdC/YwlC family)